VVWLEVRLLVGFGWSVGGDGVVGGADGGEVWRGRCVVPVCVIRFRWLQMWWHPFHSRLILLRRTSGSFVVVRIVVVVVVHVGSCGASDFACLVADPPRGHCVFCYFFYFKVVFSLCGGGGFRLRGLWWLCVGDCGVVLVKYGWVVVVVLDSNFVDESYIRSVVYVRRKVFVGGDFFWRQPLLFGSLFVVTSSCLHFLGLLRCLRCLERWWQLYDHSDRSFSDVAQLWFQDWEFNFEGCFSLGVGSDDEWYWISFLQWLLS